MTFTNPNISLIRMGPGSKLFGLVRVHCTRQTKLCHTSNPSSATVLQKPATVPSDYLVPPDYLGGGEPPEFTCQYKS